MDPLLRLFKFLRSRGTSSIRKKPRKGFTSFRLRKYTLFCKSGLRRNYNIKSDENPAAERVSDVLSERFHMSPGFRRIFKKTAFFKNKVHGLFTNNAKKLLTTVSFF